MLFSPTISLNLTKIMIIYKIEVKDSSNTAIASVFPFSSVYGFVTSNNGAIVIETAKGDGTSVHLYIPQFDRVQSADRQAS